MLQFIKIKQFIYNIEILCYDWWGLLIAFKYILGEMSNRFY